MEAKLETEGTRYTMPPKTKFKKRTKAEQAELQARHDRYVIELDRVTAIPLVELSREEFNWLGNRWAVPLGESERSKVCRQFVNQLISDQQTAVYEPALALAYETGRYVSTPSLSEIEDQTYARVQQEKLKWPE